MHLIASRHIASHHTAKKGICGAGWHRDLDHRPRICQGMCLSGGSNEQFIHPEGAEIIIVWSSACHYGVDEVVVRISKLKEGSIGALIKRLLQSAGGRVDGPA